MVFVISKSKRPLSPVHNGEARRLLSSGLAVVHRRFPFVIRLKSDVSHDEKSFTIKLDPGSKETGFSIMDKNVALFLGIIQHRGDVIKSSLKKRSGTRCSRRNRKTRYRKVRFDNRTRPAGWLPPSVKSRADNVVNFIKKFSKYIPISKVEIESVSFDTSSMTVGIGLRGQEFCQGPAFNQTLRSAVFAKSGGLCVYCGNVGSELEHIVPKSAGGTNSFYNLACSCRTCNERKGKLSLKAFGKLVGKDFSSLEPKKLPKDAAIIQAARNYTIAELSKFVETEAFPAWMTAANRLDNGFDKQHFYDAMCVGISQSYYVANSTKEVLVIKAVGRGSRQMCLMDRFGFQRTSPKGSKQVFGFKTGDLVKAIVIKGKHMGTHNGKVAVRSTGSFNVGSGERLVQGVSHRCCKIIQKADGYEYTVRPISFFQPKGKFDRTPLLPALKDEVSAARLFR